MVYIFKLLVGLSMKLIKLKILCVQALIYQGYDELNYDGKIILQELFLKIFKNIFLISTILYFK